MIRTHVAIIGAGLAGLHAAYRLHRAGIDFILLEARNRLGGRILSVDESGAPSDDGFDLGPSWYWPRVQPAIADLITELGLASFPQNGDGDVLVERMSREGPQRFRGESQEPVSFRLAGGTASLVRALARMIPAERVLPGGQVTELTMIEDGVVVTVMRGEDGPTETIAAAHVIACLPPRLLATHVRFSPPLDAVTLHRWRETPTWMASHAKFIASYDRAFWREGGLSGTAQSMVGPMPEMHDASTAAGAPAIFGFLGVSADQRTALGRAAITQACVAQLVRLFGADASTPCTTLFMDWAAEPFTATMADRTAGGHPAPHTAPWVIGEWQDRLTLGGSEASVIEPGYLAGAIVASTQAVADVLQRPVQR